MVRSFRPYVISAIGLATVLLATPGSGGAAIPSRTPSTFKYVVATLNDGDSYTRNCTYSGLEGEGLSYVYTGLDRPSEPARGGRNTLWYTGDVWVKASIDSTSVGAAVLEGQSGLSGWEYLNSLGSDEDGTVLRIAWIGWNAEVNCDVWINGVPVTPENGDTSKATYLLASDMDSGLAVDSNFGSVALDMTYTRDSTGFLTATLFGEFEVEKPDGTIVRTSQGFDNRIDEITSGTWRYALDRKVSQYDGPAIVLAELT